MRVTTSIPIQNIRNCKSRLNLKTLKFAVALLRGDLFPPIKARRLRDGTYLVSDGRHRVSAHKLAGRKEIRANIGISQDPNPHKPIVHGPDKPLRVSKERGGITRQSWLEL